MNLDALRLKLNVAIQKSRGSRIPVLPWGIGGFGTHCLLAAAAGAHQRHFMPAVAYLGITEQEASALEQGFEDWEDFRPEMSSPLRPYYDLGQEYRRNCIAYVEALR